MFDIHKIVAQILQNETDYIKAIPMVENKSETLRVRLTESQKKKLMKIAAKLKMRLSDLIRTFLLEKIDNEK